MKLAVCLSGFVRPAHSQLATFKKHFMEVNRDAEIDIYSCVWDIEGDADPWHTIEDLRTDNMCIYSGKFTRLNGKKLEYDAYVKELESLGAHQVIHKVQNYDEHSKTWMGQIRPFHMNFGLAKTPYTIIAKKSMWHGVKEAFDMIPDPNKYDYIIRSRTDNVFAEDIKIGPTVHIGPQRISFHNKTPLENPHIRDVMGLFQIPVPTSDRSIMLPWRKHDANKYIDDMWFVGPPDVMKDVTRIYDELDRYIDKLLPMNFPGVESETIIVAQILSNNIHINYFEKLPSLAKG